MGSSINSGSGQGLPDLGGFGVNDQGIPSFMGPEGAAPGSYGTLGGYPTLRPYPFGAFSGGGTGGGIPGGAGGPLPFAGGGFQTPLSNARPAAVPRVKEERTPRRERRRRPRSSVPQDAPYAFHAERRNVNPYTGLYMGNRGGGSR